MARKGKARGLGDTIEKAIHATGINNVFEIFVDGKDCRCDKRKEWLNKKFPYRFKARCFTERELEQYSEFKKIELKSVMQADNVKYICDLYASVFSRQIWYPCEGCQQGKEILSMISKLDKVYESYNIKFD